MDCELCGGELVKLTFEGRQVEVEFRWLGLDSYHLESCYWADSEECLSEQEKDRLSEDPDADLELRQAAASFRNGW